MKLAKLEMKLIMSLFLLGYEYDVVDTKGDIARAVPRVNRNDHHQVRRLGPVIDI